MGAKDAYLGRKVTRNRPIKVFLGGFVNLANAQNYNCMALAKNLDDKRFSVRAMTLYSGDILDVPMCKEQLIHCRYPARLTVPLAFLRGIFWCDIAYLPKLECWKWCRFLLWILHKRGFKTVEGFYVGTNITKVLEHVGTMEGIRRELTYTGNTYSITHGMVDVNARTIDLTSANRVLYLGVEGQEFHSNVERHRLTDVVMIGGNLYYKGINDYFNLARMFPALTFHVVGSGLGKVSPADEVRRLGLVNVVCHGALSHAEIAKLLRRIQLHVFPSRAEGFPKVILETAAAGVPSLVYDDYHANEWIDNGVNGYVVHELSQMRDVIKGLLSNPERIYELSHGARKLSDRFEWRVLIKDWEREIERIYNGG